MANIIATVNPSSSYSSGLCPSILGMILKHALSNIVISSSFYQCCGTGSYFIYKYVIIED